MFKPSLAGRHTVAMRREAVLFALRILSFLRVAVSRFVARALIGEFCGKEVIAGSLSVFLGEGHVGAREPEDKDRQANGSPNAVALALH